MIPIEKISGFLSAFKGSAGDITRGLADIDLQDDTDTGAGTSTKGLKYMSQLVRCSESLNKSES
jgi:hypothetical protein